MPRSLSLLVLLAMAGCAPAPELLSPRVKPPPKPKPWLGVTYQVLGPSAGQSEGMPVAVPDTTKLEPMPVLRPDTSIDPLMATRWYGSTFRLRIRGPAGKIEPGPPLDSVLRVAPRP